MKRNFDDVLNECLDRLQGGGKIEECLSRHPEMAEELAPLLHLAQSMLTTSKALQPREETKEAILQRILRAQQDKAPRPAQRALFLRPWAVALAAILLITALGATTTVASTNSVPGKPLYPVKMFKERVEMTFATSDEAKARLHARLARERAHELEVLARRGKNGELEHLAQRIETHLSKSANLATHNFPQIRQLSMDSIPPSNIDPKKWRRWLTVRDTIYRDSQYHEVLMKEVLPRVPPQRRPQFIRAVERSQQGYIKALQTMGHEGR